MNKDTFYMYISRKGLCSSVLIIAENDIQDGMEFRHNMSVVVLFM